MGKFDKAREWENPRIIGINKVRAHAEPDEYRWQKSLNGEWFFRYSPSPDLRPDRFHEINYSLEGWDTITVPLNWEIAGYGSPQYLAFAYPEALSTGKGAIPRIDGKRNPVGSYKRKFILTPEWMDRRIFLHFGGVKSAFYLWVNGEFAGYSQGSMTPAEFDITALVQSGENQLAVEVYQYSDGTYLEDQDMWFLGGIFRDVFLYGEPAVFLRDFHARCLFDGDYADCELIVEALVEGGESLGEVDFQVLLVDRESPADRRVIFEGPADLGEGGRLLVKNRVEAPRKWSAETPFLYRIEIGLYGRDGEARGLLVDRKSFSFGFRQIEIRGDRFLINGKPILFKGVNRHDFDPERGWAVSEELRRRDILIMKRHNINAIRTSHYPNPSHLYRLADQYGLYVIDEADVETHGVRRKNVPGSNPLWTDAVVDRVERMVLRDRNHPSVVMWSLGNEAGFGHNFRIMKSAVRDLDDTRPVHYEGDRTLEVSDVYSLMYPTPGRERHLGEKRDEKMGFLDNLMNRLVADNKAFRASRYGDKPIISCEFAHAMENSLGNFQEHRDNWEKYPNWAGGFVWDFVDQAIFREGQWLYGGDFGKGKNHGIFCCNGLVGPDRTPHPSLHEVKKVYQSLRFKEVDRERRRYSIQNDNLFISTGSFEFTGELRIEGRPADRRTLDVPPIPPGGQVKITLPGELFANQSPGERVLLLSCRTKQPCPWAPEGHEIAWEQFELDPRPREARIGGGGSDVELIETFRTVTLRTRGVTVDINRSNALIHRLDYNRGNVLKSPLVPCFSRASTDNDRGMGNFIPLLHRFSLNERWFRRQKKVRARRRFHREFSEGKTRITFHLRIRGIRRYTLSYTLFRNGELLVENSLTPVKEMIRLGMETSLDGTADRVQWYGRGDQETYCDRKGGAKIGVYSASVDELCHNYVRPQENGNRTDVRWMRVQDDRGRGLSFEAVGERLLEATCRPYSQEDLHRAEHIHELPRRDRVTVHLDWGQRGVGGDLPGQLSLLEPYRIRGKRNYSYAFLIRKTGE